MYSRFIDARSSRPRERRGDVPGDDERPTPQGHLPMPGEDSLAALNRVTIGHVVLGFLGFRQSLLREDQREPHWRFLCHRELLALERWQEQHDAGTLAADMFARAVEVLIADRAPNMAFAGFGMMGSIVPRTPRDVVGGRPDLSASQRREARDIHWALHEAVRMWRMRTHDQIRKELGLGDAGLVAFLRDDARRPCGQEPTRLLQRMMQELRLVGDQQAKIVVECALLRCHVEREHQTARSRFISLLTTLQWEDLEAIERVPPGPSVGL